MFSRRWVTAAVWVVLSATVASCGADRSANRTADGRTELTIATFNEFGYEELFAEYEAAHPDVKIVQRKTGQGAPHHQNLFTKLGAGAGLADVEAVEEGYLSQVMAKADQFHDLLKTGPRDVTPDRWLKWKADAATTRDGRLIGYGTDIGPLAMCYRKDLFAEAGLPSDPDEVKRLFSSWDTYFAAGDRFVAAVSGVAWFDSAAQIFNAMHNQHDVGYFDTSDTLVVESNQDIRDDWAAVTNAVARGQSAKLPAFSAEWNTGFKLGRFATKTCPSWMLGVIEAQAGPENAGKWAVTDAFPDGGGNWGGSYLTVPKQSENPDKAAELAAWLTAPEQQIKAFQARGTFPSQVDALENRTLLEQVNTYFDNVKAGALFAAQVQKVKAAQYKGPADGQIQENVFGPALQSVEQGKNPAEAWNTAVKEAKKAAE
ncbi:extracellular solute-binding protein [Lentzea sp. NBRC 102530]|uniref:ABC transporter substrate-binding protein n=1 Tax=Lentzea sp. NBRC 102530 TaxID=3032201 RepID=UPI0024A518BB|nr:extracellular solute-binding protein [Lentzea sp. NBRC 102530]GLY50223.1 sugar ABC transporter substrate-binding protein [Lentzea sp. NBRC 102530]